MSDITSLYINGVQQPDNEGVVDLALSASVKYDEFNNGFTLKIGTEEVVLKTTSEVVKNQDGTISDETFVDDNALVRSETLRTFVETQNQMQSTVNAGVIQMNSKTVPQYGGMGFEDGTVAAVVIEGLSDTLGTNILPVFEAAGIKPTLLVNPDDIKRGYGVKPNGEQYNVLSVSDLHQLRDNGYSFCDTISDENQYASASHIVKDSFIQSQEWLLKNGISTCAFSYPYAVDLRIKTIARQHRQAAIRIDGGGTNQIDADAYELSVANITEDNFSEVQDLLFEASDDNVLVILKFKAYDSAIINKASILIEQIKSNGITMMSLEDAINAKVRAFNIGQEEEFYVRKDGVVRATLDDQSKNKLFGSLKFSDLSSEFKNDLLEYIKNAGTEIPAIDAELLIDGEEYTEATRLTEGEYELGYKLYPENATSGCNHVSFYLDDMFSLEHAQIVQENTLMIQKNVVATVAWTSDTDSKDGLQITELEQPEPIGEVKVIMKLSTPNGDIEHEYVFII